MILPSLRLIAIIVFVLGLMITPWFPQAPLQAGAGNLAVPVRWCGIEGAPSMADPGAMGEASANDVLWRRHERPSDATYIPYASMTFRAGATGQVANGVYSFPIIRGLSGPSGNVTASDQLSTVINQCKRAWLVGDPLYYDVNNNGVANSGDTLLSTTMPSNGFLEPGHLNAPLNTAPLNVRFVDLDGDGTFDLSERLYRDENADGTVDMGDTLLSANATVLGYVNPADMLATLVAVPAQIKYLDLIRPPANTFNIGDPSVVGIVAVNPNDLDLPSYGFPVHGVGGCGWGAIIDDSSQYLPPGPDFRLFETHLVGHEFGHALCLNHGDGNDDNGNGIIDDSDDPSAPFTNSLGTLCDSNNVMQYCWQDHGVAGAPDMRWIGVGELTSTILVQAQATIVRTQALTLPDTQVDPVPLPLLSERSDVVGDVPDAYAYVDLADVAVRVDPSAKVTTFSLTTLRPFPNLFQLAFYVLVDADNDLTTGGTPAILGAPTDFKGAELAIIVRANRSNRPPVNASAFKFDPSTRAFGPLQGRIAVTWVPLNVIVDFAGPSIRLGEKIAIRMADAARGPLATNFRVEYLSQDLQSKTVDRVRTQMGFVSPVFPECKTEPGVVPAGGKTTVVASRLLPNRSVHVLLGEKQVAEAVTDAGGNSTASFTVPRRTTQGNHLVTIGALAVTGDCFLLVKGTWNYPIYIGLVAILLIVLVISLRRRAMAR